MPALITDSIAVAQPSLWDKITHLQFSQAVVDTYMASFIAGAFRFIVGMVVLFVGFWLLNRIFSWFDSKVESKRIDRTIKTFLKNLVNIGSKVLLIFLVLNIIGFQSSSLVAVVGAVGLGAGLALQGSLANFAGGILLLLFKPFKVGDKIEVQGKKGRVVEIQILNTLLQDGEKKIVIPNSMVSNGVVTNLTSKNEMVSTITFCLDASVKLDTLRPAMAEWLQANEKSKPITSFTLEIADFDKNTMFIEMEYKLPNQSGLITANDIREEVRDFLVAHKIKLTDYNEIYRKLFPKPGVE